MKKRISQKKSESCFWVILSSQHSCNKIVVATKCMAVNVCSPLKSSQRTLPLWSGKSKRILLLIFCGNRVVFVVILKVLFSLFFAALCLILPYHPFSAVLSSQVYFVSSFKVKVVPYTFVSKVG